MEIIIAAVVGVVFGVVLGICVAPDRSGKEVLQGIRTLELQLKDVMDMEKKNGEKMISCVRGTDCDIMSYFVHARTTMRVELVDRLEKLMEQNRRIEGMMENSEFVGRNNCQ